MNGILSRKLVLLVTRVQNMGIGFLGNPLWPDAFLNDFLFLVGRN
jgi:hypothetical protein